MVILEAIWVVTLAVILAMMQLEQVRQPIFTDAADQWRAYEPWLDPLKAALGPALDCYPAASPN